MITPISIEEIENNENYFYNECSDENVEDLTNELLEMQPAIFEYIISVNEELKEENRDFFSDVSMLIWLSFKTKYPKLREISFEEIETKEMEVTDQMEAISEEGSKALLEETMARLFDSPQPDLVAYVYEELNEAYPPTTDNFNTEDFVNRYSNLSAEELMEKFRTEFIDKNDISDTDSDVGIMAGVLINMITLFNNAIVQPPGMYIVN